jgi:hypothetical protein
VNRAQLQQLAEERSLDAQVLLSGGRWSGAYYLAGYAVECALKACIAKLTGEHDFPDKEFVNKCYTHKIELLVVLAGLKAQRDADAAVNPAWNPTGMSRKTGTRAPGISNGQKLTHVGCTKPSHHQLMESCHGSRPAGNRRD